MKSGSEKGGGSQVDGGWYWEGQMGKEKAGRVGGWSKNEGGAGRDQFSNIQPR